MKIISYISSLFLLAFSISCSDDFLYKYNREMTILPDTIFINSTQDTVETTVQVGVISKSEYTILMQPKWLSFSSMHGIVRDGKAFFTLSIVKEYIPNEIQTQYSEIYLALDNGELLIFFVGYTNFGTPLLECSASSLTFESSAPQTFTVRNTQSGLGILNWEITGVPDWLIISETSGSLTTNDPITISASLNLDKIPHGNELSGNLQINSNSITGNILIPYYVSEEVIDAMRKIEGIVTDSEYNHGSGIIVICTKSPNTLIVFNTSTNESNTISLGRTPNCVSLSEDGHKAVIGYSFGDVSSFDVDRLELTADYTIDCKPYDIVLDDNGWCYISPVTDSNDHLRNIDLNSGKLIACTNSSTFNGNTILRKIHGKPYLVGTRPYRSPSGLLIFDITEGKASDTIAYYHEDIGNFWISVDGTNLYALTKKVYSLPEYNGQYNFDPPPVHGIIESEFYHISGLDECPAINSIFLFSSYFGYTSETASRIEQFNTINLNRTATFHVAPVTVAEKGLTLEYQTSPKYIFVNKEGSILYVIKNLNENAHKDYWALESIKIDNPDK
jgi:hypothetical protein